MQVLEISLEKMIINLFFVIIFALLFPVGYQIRNFIIWNSPDWYKLVNLMLALIEFGLCFILFNGFKLPTNIKEESTKPNQGIWNSVRNVLIYMMIVMPTGAIIGFLWAAQTKFIDKYVALTYGMALGLIGSILIFGQGSGIVCIKHFIMRITLCWCSKHIPWNYAHFLDYAVERLFLQKVGGGYIFVHRMLLEHFARMELEQKQH